VTTDENFFVKSPQLNANCGDI